MKRVLLISLSLFLALVGWSTVCADDGFYVVAGQRGNYAPVPKTGQITSYATGDDGALQKGIASPSSRFTDNGNGTVTDKLTGLIWMKKANAFGTKNWADALSAANILKSGDPGTGLTDGSKAGDWRLPNVRELRSLVDFGKNSPALPEGNPFTGVELDFYWSSTSFVRENGSTAWYMDMDDGDSIGYDGVKTNTYYVWCVRGGR